VLGFYVAQPLTSVLLSLFSQDATASNLVLAIYGFSKINSCREFLMAPPFQIDRVINKLSMMDNPKIKANCGRAYKNFNSDVNEAIEEGAVASLIAMSLEVRGVFCLSTLKAP
jgi:hypothetical protein